MNPIDIPGGRIAMVLEKEILVGELTIFLQIKSLLIK